MRTLSKRGSTFVEMMVYIAILVVLVQVGVSTTILVAKSYKTLKATKNLETSAVNAFERMTREIRGAISVVTASSVLGSSPGDLVMNTTDSSGSATTTELYLSSGVLHIKTGGVDKGPLTSSGVSITSLIFQSITATKSKGVRVTATFQSTVGPVVKSKTFYSTVDIRGSY